MIKRWLLKSQIKKAAEDIINKYAQTFHLLAEYDKKQNAETDSLANDRSMQTDLHRSIKQAFLQK